MRRIAQRELRNDVAHVLRQARAGETIEVTVRGEVVAEIGPPRGPRLTDPSTARRILHAAPADPRWLDDLRAQRTQAEADETDFWPE